MRIITIARKPMNMTAAECALEWGTGSLNIDGCRITAFDPFGGGAKMSSSGGRSLGQFSEHYASGSGWIAGNSSGRWPSNLILQHSDACEIIGERKVKTGEAVRQNSGGKTIFSETAKPPMKNMTYGQGGKESIPDWRCAEGCPVSDLDNQSGITTSKSHTRHNKGSWKVRKKGNTTASVDTTHSDTGGASRFFKQVKPTF